MANAKNKLKLLSLLIPLLLLHAILATQIGVAARIISVIKTISFPEFDVSVNPRIVHDVKLLGSAKLSVDKQSIQIPDSVGLDDIRHQAGRAIYSSPVRVFDPNTRTPASFDTTFSFQFNSHFSPSYNQTSEEDAHGGSGLTFIIAPDEFTVGRPGPWLGMLNDACDDEYYKFIAIEFDTRCNPEFGDPNDNHIGVNLGSIVSNTTINASTYGLAFEDGSIHRIRIIYDGPTRKMDIQVGSNSVFSDKIDISPHLNEYMFVGFSASTGNKTQIHNILSWNFTSISPAVLRYPSAETCESKILEGKTLIEDKKVEPIKEEEKKPSTTFLIFICVVALFLVILLNLYCSRSSARSSNSGPALFGLPEKNYRPRPPNKPHRFTATELSLATKGFSDMEILGSDSSGILYKGTLTNGLNIAVKRFSTQLLGSLAIDRKRFMKRVSSLRSLAHPSLVPIRGWCYDAREFMIVYEYMFNGCLDKWLFGVGVLPWSRRFKVVKNIANGLSHLHSHQLAHNNVQVSCVFLDVSFKALLGDFGLGDPIGVDPSSSRSIDVFNFGVFVLEVVAGRKKVEIPTNDRLVEKEGRMDLLDYAWMMHEKDEKIKMVDRRMGSGVDEEQATRVLDVALLCTLPETNGRPKMEDVVKFLKMEEILPELPKNRPMVLFPYSSGPALCGGYVCAPYPFK